MREDSAEQFRSAGRPELAEKEEAEIAVLKQFMPAELTAEETAAILETVMKETGAVTIRLATLHFSSRPGDWEISTVPGS